MKNPVFIFGGGGHGKVILDILQESKANVKGFLDDDPKKVGTKINGVPVLGNLSYAAKIKSAAIVVAIGNNEIRLKVQERAVKEGLKIVNAIHPKAVVAKSVTIGRGVVIMAGAVVNPSATLEDGVVVNTGATVDHDCHLKKFSHIWPGAHLAGTVSVGELSYVGTGAAVIQNINIGDHVMIGAGTVVIKDVPSNVTIVGVPAKTIKVKNA